MTGVLTIVIGATVMGMPAAPGVGDGRPTATARTAVEELEKRLAAAPDDVDLRSRLLTAYFLDRSPEGRAARTRHALWIIEHAPEADIAGMPYASLDRILDPEGYERARALWLGHVEKDGKNPKILAYAARFLLLHDRDRAEELLQRGARLEPDDPEWRERLGQLYDLEDTDRTPDPKAARKALGHYEAALAATKGDTGRYYALGDLSEAAHRAGEQEKAREYALELLELAQALPRDWNYGNAIHDGHRILGHVALLHGDTAAAKEHLLAAGATTGSPQLNSFGPELTLASALLAKGEREAVVEYLRLCSRFWRDRTAAIEEWIVLIQAGQTPDLDRFGARVSQP